MAALEPLLTPQRQMTRDLVVAASRPDRAEFRDVERLTKGIEVPLPNGHFFHDKDGHERRSMRIKWWNSDACTFPALALMPDEDRLKLPDEAVPAGANCGYAGTKPVFFGHYWMQDAPQPLTHNAACVDYSVAKGGKLVAYRHEAGAPLSTSGFTWVGL